MSMSARVCLVLMEGLAQTRSTASSVRVFQVIQASDVNQVGLHRTIRNACPARDVAPKHFDHVKQQHPSAP